jgi:4-amino-4-deoxy-L-arabinose transferase-like glycosyltransferase
MNYSKIIKYKYEIIIILMAITIRIILIWQPLLEYYPTRQVMTASVARNFFRYGYNIFFPELDFNGTGPSLYAVEFPLYPFLVAIFYGITNSVHEIFGRLLNIAFFVASLFPFFKLVNKYTNQNTAKWSILFFSFSPLSILVSRAFLPETLMICLFIYSLWLFDRWLDNNNFYIYALSTFITATSVIVRPYALIILLPMAYLAWCRYKRKTFTNIYLLIFPLVIIIPSLIWYLSIWSISREMEGGGSVVGGAGLWTSSHWNYSILTEPIYYKKMWDHISGVALTPLGLPFVILGLLIREENKKVYFFHAWFLGVTVFFIILPMLNSVHTYYQFLLIPVAAVFFGKAINKLQLVILKRSFLDLSIVKISMIFFTIGIILFYIRPIFSGRVASHQNIITAGKAVQELTNRKDIIIAAKGSGPGFLYYSDRKGWDFLIQRSKLIQLYKDQSAPLDNLILDPIVILESYRKEGAAYFAAADMKEFNSEPTFATHMRTRYGIVRETPKYIIFDIRKIIGN